jgi:predicted metal-dependent hydrolase
MTDLQIRRIPFEFDETVPFQWHPTNPEFGVNMVGTGLFVIGFEKYIVGAMRLAMPHISDPAAAEEADAFLRQEAIHARAHRMHMKALIGRYPGLQGVIDEVVASYDHLLETKPLKFHLAYIAALEATFTPFFKALLDNREHFFAPGDPRVASLLEWHFVEEVEHRSSGLVVYNAVVPHPWYRLLVLPQAMAHINGLMKKVWIGFQEHVPAEDRGVDLWPLIHPVMAPLRKLGARLPVLRRRIAVPVSSNPKPYGAIPKSELKAMAKNLLRSQMPHHDPEHQPLPAFAAEWFDAYDRGIDMTAYSGTSVAS